MIRMINDKDLSSFSNEEVIEFLIQVVNIVNNQSKYIEKIICIVDDLSENQKDILSIFDQIDTELKKLESKIKNNSKCNLYLNKIYDLMSEKINEIKRSNNIEKIN